MALLFAELLVVILIGFYLHGAVLGNFVGWNLLHLTKTAFKMLVLALGTTALCAPALFVFSALRGSNITLKQFVLLLLGKLAITSLVLLGFLPVVWFFIFTNDNNRGFINGMNIAVLFIASIFSFWFLQNGVRYLFTNYKKEDQTTQAALDVLLVWFIVFAAVAIQMYLELSPWLKLTNNLFK